MANLNGFLKVLTITSKYIKIEPCIRKVFLKTDIFSHYYLWKNYSLSSFSPKVLEVTTDKISKPVEISTILENTEYDSIVSADIKQLTKENESALDDCKESVSDFTPFIKPSFNIAAFVNKSTTLQELVKLGVKLYKLEKNKEIMEFILRLDFEENIKGHLRFLHDVGVPAEEFGRYLTKNPYILKEDLKDMQIRINYLESKLFTQDMITRIVSKNPKWLSFRVIEIDKRLGYFQRTFILSGQEVRELATKRPVLITYNRGHIEEAAFKVKEEMGFSPEEAKQLLLNRPKLFTIRPSYLSSRFHYVHNKMKISHERIVAQPSVLLYREFIIKQRHLFLESLGRAQYDPKLPGYVSLDSLVSGTDIEFCQNVAKTSVNSFNLFLKSL